MLGFSLSNWIRPSFVQQITISFSSCVKIKLEILLIYVYLSFYFITITYYNNFTVFHSIMRFSNRSSLASIQSLFVYGYKTLSTNNFGQTKKFEEIIWKIDRKKERKDITDKLEIPPSTSRTLLKNRHDIKQSGRVGGSKQQKVK